MNPLPQQMSLPRTPSQAALRFTYAGHVILYAASSNPGKLREFQRSAGQTVSSSGHRESDAQVLALPGLGDLPEPAENALTFIGNAELKAEAYSRAALQRLGPGLLVFADDSGLEVDALGRRPGVRSARFAEDLAFEPGWVQGRNERNLHALLMHMTDVPEERRTARFRCALALACDGEVRLRAEGTVEGVLLREARGQGGFGYDPVFFVASLGKTLAEMTHEEKWGVSHRGRAFADLLARLEP